MPFVCERETETEGESERVREKEVCALQNNKKPQSQSSQHKLCAYKNIRHRDQTRLGAV